MFAASSDKTGGSLNMAQTISLDQLPTWAKLEITKDDLLAFAKQVAQELRPSVSVTPSVPKQEILTAEEAASFLNLAKQTLYGMTSRKEIPFIKKSRKIYFSRAELEKWLLEGRQKTQNEIALDAKGYINQLKERRAKK
jgi:excisionase family DNA binding protein